MLKTELELLTRKEQGAMKDFPAAHSMDTNWFAVDADGYIGYFDSSEGGAVPNTWKKAFQETKIEYSEDFLIAWKRSISSNVIEIKTSKDLTIGLLDLSEVLEIIDRAKNDYKRILKKIKSKPKEIQRKLLKIINFLMFDKIAILDF